MKTLSSTKLLDDWTEKVESWIKEVGLQEVAKALALDRTIHSVRLFAVGRFVAHFKSYGYHQASSSVAVCSWPQIARIRNALTNDSDILNSLYESIVEERSRVALVTPIPYEVELGGTRIVFSNVWNEFREDPQQPS